MRRKSSLIRGLLIAACVFVGACLGDLGGDLGGAGVHGDHAERAQVPKVSGFTARAPGASVFSSAATPLGRETAAERRHEEWSFANGEDVASQAPPDAIGGGPEDFADQD